MNEQKKYRILFIGTRWQGSNAYACCKALRRLGHFVLDIDEQVVFPDWKMLILRAIKKIILPIIVNEYNKQIIRCATQFKPDFILAFKGMYIHPKTILKMNKMGIKAYNYFPDVSAFSHKSKLLPVSMQFYDCIFSTKAFLKSDMELRGFKLRNFVYLPHGYDPELVKPVDIDDLDRKDYGSDVIFIGSYTKKKEKILSELINNLPDLDLAIWGEKWNKCKSNNLKRCIKGRGIYGIEYVKALYSSKIALGLLSERQIGSSMGDQITSRTFNIPATGTFMIHERTQEVLNYFNEGSEIECFSTVSELTQKIKYYLKNEQERKKIAELGYKRCISQYSYDNRMKLIIDWHSRYINSF